MDDRVLTEALANTPGTAPKAEQKTLEATYESSRFRWRQHFKESAVGSAIYFDEGNGESVQK